MVLRFFGKTHSVYKTFKIMLKALHPWSQSVPAKTASACVISVFSAYLAIKSYTSKRSLKLLEKQRRNRVIVITGCDSGLGYSMAAWAASLGYTVLAGCLQPNGEAAKMLRKQFPEHIIVVELDVTDSRSLENIEKACRDILGQNEERLRLWAVIVNAAVSTFGEFMWQTSEQCKRQMDVNFWGAVNFISEFRSLLFDSKARVIVISSDCSNYPFPYLSIYSASKAALDTWAQSFRFEVAKYGIHVVAYHPRDFAGKSGLFANLNSDYTHMAQEMSESEKKFYGDYFDKFMKKKQEVFDSTPSKRIEVLDSQHHRETFTFLLEKNIERISVYRDFSWPEKVLHFLYESLPQRQVDKLVGVLLNPDFRTICWKKPAEVL